MHILITGGAGFIGSALIRRLLVERAHTVVNVDKLTYAALPGALAEIENTAGYAFVQADVTDRVALDDILERQRPDGIIHLAAESHVDRSIASPSPFVATNVNGTHCLLQAAMRYYGALAGERRAAFRWLQVSTDEVYGSADSGQVFDEQAAYKPNSPYAASKAGADHLVRAWHQTYGLPVLVSHGVNTYGPFQFPEKLVPVAVYRALSGGVIPLYGGGAQQRDWLHVDDHVAALLRVFEGGTIGARYNIGAGEARTNLELVRQICEQIDYYVPTAAPSARRIRFVADRAGHDRRYALDSSRIRNELGWRPRIDLQTGLAATVRWCIDHPDLLARLPAG